MISVLSFIGSVCAPDKAILKAENHGLGPDLVGIHCISLAARFRVAACFSSTDHGHNCTPLFALSLPFWQTEFLVPSMAFNTANAYDIVCRLDRDDTLDEVSQNKKQKIATGLLLDKLHKQDFAGPLSSRVSRALGAISRHRAADILHRRKNVSRASRLGYSLVSYASYVMGSALHRDLTLKNMITPAVLDAQMNLTLSHITMNVTGCTTFWFLSGDMLRYCQKEIIFYTTWSLVCSCTAFNMELW